MKLELKNFHKEGTGWTLFLDDECLCIIMPSDLESIASTCSARKESIAVLHAKVREFYQTKAETRE